MVHDHLPVAGRARHFVELLAVEEVHPRKLQPRRAAAGGLAADDRFTAVSKRAHVQEQGSALGR